MSVMLAACGSAPKDEFAGIAPDKLYADAKEDTSDGNFETAIKKLEKVEARASGTLLAQQAQLDLAYANWKAGEKEATRYVSLRVISNATAVLEMVTAADRAKVLSASVYYLEGGKLVLRRPMYAGNVSGNLTVDTAKQVITGRQTEFDAAEPTGGNSPVSSVAEVTDPASSRIEFVSLEVVKSERPELARQTVAACAVGVARSFVSASVS